MTSVSGVSQEKSNTVVTRGRTGEHSPSGAFVRTNQKAGRCWSVVPASVLAAVPDSFSAVEGAAVWMQYLYCLRRDRTRQRYVVRLLACGVNWSDVDYFLLGRVCKSSPCKIRHSKDDKHDAQRFAHHRPLSVQELRKPRHVPGLLSRVFTAAHSQSLLLKHLLNLPHLFLHLASDLLVLASVRQVGVVRNSSGLFFHGALQFMKRALGLVFRTWFH